MISTFLLVSASAITLTAAQETVTLRQLDAHVHGEAELIIAVDANGLALAELSTPAWNLFGFEGEAETDAQMDIVRDAEARLNNAGLVGLPANANCQLSEFELIGAPESAHDHHDDHGDDHGDHNHDHDHATYTHSDSVVSWTLQCANVDVIDGIELTALFDAFENLQTVDVEFVASDAVAAGVLSANSSRLRLPR